MQQKSCKAFHCDCCDLWLHFKCADICLEDVNRIQSEPMWLCQLCSPSVNCMCTSVNELQLLHSKNMCLIVRHLFRLNDLKVRHYVEL